MPLGVALATAVCVDALPTRVVSATPVPKQINRTAAAASAELAVRVLDVGQGDATVGFLSDWVISLIQSEGCWSRGSFRSRHQPAGIDPAEPVASSATSRRRRTSSPWSACLGNL